MNIEYDAPFGLNEYDGMGLGCQEPPYDPFIPPCGEPTCQKGKRPPCFRPPCPPPKPPAPKKPACCGTALAAVAILYLLSK